MRAIPADLLARFQPTPFSQAWGRIVQEWVAAEGDSRLTENWEGWRVDEVNGQRVRALNTEAFNGEER